MIRLLKTYRRITRTLKSSLLGIAVLSSNAFTFQAAQTFAADPELTRLYPSGGQAGTTVNVEATGKFPVWPLQIWSDSEAIEWTCLADSGKVQVKLGPNASPGLHWMRMHAPNGATIARPFLVGQAPELIETEPNDRVQEANAIASLPFTAQGILNKRGDVDLYAVTLADNGLLAATIDGNKWLLSPADVSMQVLDQRGFVLAENIDHVGLDPYLEFRTPKAGTYLVRVFGFPANPDSSIGFSGGSDWVYRLRLNSGSCPFDTAMDHLLQSELSAPATEVAIGQHVTAATAMSVALPAKLHGTIAEPKQANYIRFAAKAGVHYRARVLAREFGSPLDANISVLDSNAKALVQIDDIENNRDPILKWKAPADGEYLFSVVDFHRQGGSDYQYLATIEERPNDFDVNVAADLVSIVVGKETEVVVNVVRESEFAGLVSVTAFGLPASVQCTTEESKHGTDSAGKVTLKLKGTEPFQGPLELRATVVEPKPGHQTVRAVNGKPVWLSVKAE